MARPNPSIDETEMAAATVWYGVQGRRYSNGVDEWDNPIRGRHHLAVEVVRYTVARETPKGVWLDYSSGGSAGWVSKTAKKRRAYPTQEEAVASFIARKLAQRRILCSRLDDVDGWLRLAAQQFGVTIPGVEAADALFG